MLTCVFIQFSDRNLLDVCLSVLSFVRYSHEPKHDTAVKGGTYVLYTRYGVMDWTFLGKGSILRHIESEPSLVLV